MSETSCPFCHLGSEVLKDNKFAVLFPSNPRKTKGHLLVTPKRHIEKPWNLTKDERLDVLELVLFAQKLIVNNISEGCDVRQNYRPFLKQSKLKVDHVHYHIIPRNLNDDLYDKVEKYETDMFKKLSEAEYKEIVRIIKKV